jgi:RNA polymerase sigma-70 factor (ECF subfamily)
MPPDDSFADLMVRLRAGDPDAAAQVFHRFQTRLIALAQRRLGAALRQKEDPEDVVQSVFKSFFRRQAAGQFDLASGDKLWNLLTRITLRKCGHRLDYFRAARRDVQREVALGPTADDSRPGPEALAREPTPVEAATLAEIVERLMRSLEESDRHIFQLSLQGESVAHISRQVNLSERTVERVRGQIRRCLERLQAGRGEL